ncbi:MAG: redox-regulated ATPase YchF, partial [Deltaproteobacteria bacterium]|nr:redox-regulated ATPase YchF [Deltaproteobacteria bacterium]
TELIIADLEQCEKRIERMEKERIQAGSMQLEHELLKRITVWLTSGRPLRVNPELNENELIKSFAFLSGKPVITVVNTSEQSPEWSPDGLSKTTLQDRVGSFGSIISLCGKIEQEIASLGKEDAAAFLEDFGIHSPAGERVIKECYKLLGSISFFTVGEDEVKAWTIKRGSTAKQAARVIHSDIERGFIRAEVVDCRTSVELGGFEAAKKHGKVRLEGKNYEVQDGDIISYRFAV